MTEFIIAVFDADNNDFICIAKDYYSAVSYLLEYNYLNDDLLFFDWETGKEISLNKIIPNYKTEVFEWDITTFNNTFMDFFRLDKTTIFTRVKGE